MGGNYPAGGINLGPALTFGYIAGRDLAGATPYEDDGSLAPTETNGNGETTDRVSSSSVS